MHIKVKNFHSDKLVLVAKARFSVKKVISNLNSIALGETWNNYSIVSNVVF